MTTDVPATGLQLRSLVTASGEVVLSLASVPVPEPRAHEVLVRIEAAPIHPSDLGLLLGGAEFSRGVASGSAASPVFTAPIPETQMRAFAGRLGESVPVGNEGCGVVVKAGSSPAAQALLGKTVGVAGGGAMFSEYCCVRVEACLALPAGTTSAEAAGCFVNPLTALSMVETMRAEGHKALVHTAAASNLGQMLSRICLQDGVDLVNIVRRPEQATILEELGARFVVDSSAESFETDLVEAFAVTGATIAFDAIGGGELASQILSAMETAAKRNAETFSLYGSTTNKQVYIYGGLDTGPTILHRAFGMSWCVDGFLLAHYLNKAGPEKLQALKNRVAAEIKTTFASHYTAELSLAEALNPAVIAAYSAKATGAKYLITPAKS